MNNLIMYITGGAETFTPSVMVGLIVFCILCDALFSLVGLIVGGVRK